MKSMQNECHIRFEKEKEFLGCNKPINFENPIVSVSVTTYQHKNYIRQCLDGILMQITKFPIEIIVGEDESNDGTRDICIVYAEKYPDKIRLFLRDRSISHLYDKEGKSICRFNGTWNRMSARGKYIAICEGDDYWTDPYKLQKQVDLLEQYENTSMCVALNKKNNTTTKEVITDEPYTGSNYPLIYFENLNTYFHTSTYLIRKTTMDYVFKNYANLILGDTALRFLLINEGPFVVLNDVVSVYRITGKGVWSSLDSHTKDLQHYNLYKSFRRHHVRENRKYYARKELRYLFAIFKFNLKKTNYREIIKQFLQIFMLIVLYIQLNIFRMLFKKN